MESKFPTRVSIERMALDIINESALFSGELVGLTRSAIAAFCASQQYTDEIMARLRTALLDVSVAARCEVDISDEVLLDISEAAATAALLRLRACMPNG